MIPAAFPLGYPWQPNRRPRCVVVAAKTFSKSTSPC